MEMTGGQRLMKQMDLCKPCLEAMKGDGKKLRMVKGGSDRKICCTRCGRRRFGATYEEQD